MDTPVVQQKVTELDVVKHLTDAVRLIAAGMGFDVEIKLPEVSTKEAHEETILEGYRDMGRALAMVIMGYGINPAELVKLAQTTQQTKPSGLVLPS